jgi:hypothetical protein
MSERRPLVLVATTAVVLLAGCGSSGHDPQSSFSFPSLPTPSPAIPLGGTQESFATPPKDSARSARVSVKYNKVNCATTLPGIALSEDYSKSVTATARAGYKACLVELEVKNIGTTPCAYIDVGVLLVGSDDIEYSESKQQISPGKIAQERGRELASDQSLMNVGDTEYSYILFEIPQNVRPAKVII